MLKLFAKADVAHSEECVYATIPGLCSTLIALMISTLSWETAFSGLLATVVCVAHLTLRTAAVLYRTCPPSAATAARKSATSLSSTTTRPASGGQPGLRYGGRGRSE